MNKEQMLLLKVAEECAELTQICSKIIRFGADNKKPGQEYTNSQLFNEEFADVWCTVNYYLAEKTGKENKFNDFQLNIYNQRKERIDKYLEVSKQLGIFE